MAREDVVIEVEVVRKSELAMILSHDLIDDAYFSDADRDRFCERSRRSQPRLTKSLNARATLVSLRRRAWAVAVPGPAHWRNGFTRRSERHQHHAMSRTKHQNGLC